VADDDGAAGHARCAGRLDEFLALDGECLAAHDARHGQPFDGTDGSEDQHDIALEHGEQQDDKKDKGQGVEYVDDAHHEIVDASAEIAGRCAPCDADDEADGCRDHAHHQRYAQADHQAGQEVAALDVGAQDVPVVHRRGYGARVGDGLVIMHPYERAECGDQHDHAKDPHRDHGGLVAEQAGARIVPEGAAADDGLFHGRDTAGRVEQGIDVGHQSYFTFGSSTAYSTSATRFRITIRPA